MDSRDLVFPMTAGDLVQSACVLAARKRGDGVEMHMLEVVEAEREGELLRVSFVDRVTRERSDVELASETPLLLTRIMRT